MCHVLDSHLQGLIFCFFKIIGAYLCTYFVLFLSSNNINIFFLCSNGLYVHIFSFYFFPAFFSHGSANRRNRGKRT